MFVRLDHLAARWQIIMLWLGNLAMNLLFLRLGCLVARWWIVMLWPLHGLVMDLRPRGYPSRLTLGGDILDGGLFVLRIVASVRLCGA